MSNKKIIYAISAFAIIVITIIISIFVSNRTATRIVKEKLQEGSVECGKKERVQQSYADLAEAPRYAKNNISGNVMGGDIKYPVTNLVDGSQTSLAYSNDKQIDYSVDLIDLFPIKTVTLIWGEFGTKEEYISNWYLEGCNEEGRWIKLDEGKWPQADKTIVEINEQILSEIRIHAQSTKNWIGMNELIIE